MEWVLFSVLSAFAYAIVNLVDKYVLTNWIKNPIIPILIQGVVGLIAGIVIYFIFGFSDLSYINIFLAFMSGIFYILSAWFYFKAVKIEEISRIIPILYLAPLFILILASIFLGEFFAPIKYLGIIFLIIGAILISAKKITNISFNKSFWLMILAAFLLSLNQIVTKYLLAFADYWTIFSWTRIGIIIALIPAFFFCYKDLLLTVKEHGKKVIAVVSLNESLAIVGVILITIASSIGYITLVNAMSSFQPLFVLIFAVFLSIFYPKIIKEEIGKSTIMLKFTAIVLMIAGAVLVS